MIKRGSIPARAGEPWKRYCKACYHEVYPRACGGTDVEQINDEITRGLSPRVRGNLFGPVTYRAVQRSIPARAGEPPVDCSVERGSWVYPRACGGTAQSSMPTADAGGLSPRVRGNQVTFIYRRLINRSIPARAGEPPPTCRKTSGHPVYPRACGGTLLSETHDDDGLGLSPRVRGNLVPEAEIEEWEGSIPARAGEPGSAR